MCVDKLSVKSDIRILIIAIATIISLLSLPIHAKQSCNETERFGTKIIKTGDSARRVLEQNPNRELKIETDMGGAAGFRYDFYKSNKTVQIFTEDGIVVKICHVRH